MTGYLIKKLKRLSNGYQTQSKYITKCLIGELINGKYT